MLSHLAEQANSDPKVRPQVMEAAQSSCLKTMHNVYPQSTNREAIIVNYCTCFSQRGLNAFSNAELAEIGLHPNAPLTADQNKKLDAAGALCLTEAKDKVATLTDRP